MGTLRTTPADLPEAERPKESGLTQDKTLTVTLIGLTVLGIGVCILLVAPFASGLTWAIALSVLASPVHGYVKARVSNPDAAAGITCLVVVLALLLPTLFVGSQVAIQANEGLQRLQAEVKSSQEVKEKLQAASPGTAEIVEWASQHLDWEQEMKRFEQGALGQASSVFQGTVWGAINFLISLFLLFYFFRDRKLVLDAVRFLLPTAPRETAFVLKRVHEMIRSTLYGTLFVSAIQGALGGVIFWFLGLPGAFLWGVVMGLLSIVPVLGAFVVWAPVAIFLAAQGDWTKALILTAWGIIVVGLVDNLLYPIIVGRGTRMHTVPMFVSIIGGLTVFGAAGLVLGPVALTLTWSLIEVLRARAVQHQGQLEEPAH